MTENAPRALLTLSEVQAITGIKKTAIYAWMNPACPTFDPDFPRPVRLNSRCPRWVSTEIQAWLDKQIAKRDQQRAA